MSGFEVTVARLTDIPRYSADAASGRPGNPGASGLPVLTRRGLAPGASLERALRNRRPQGGGADSPGAPTGGVPRPGPPGWPPSPAHGPALPRKRRLAQPDKVSPSRPGLDLDLRLASRTSLSWLYQWRASHETQASQPTTTIHNKIPGGLVTFESCPPCQPGVRRPLPVDSPPQRAYRDRGALGRQRRWGAGPPNHRSLRSRRPRCQSQHAQGVAEGLWDEARPGRTVTIRQILGPGSTGGWPGGVWATHRWLQRHGTLRQRFYTSPLISQVDRSPRQARVRCSTLPAGRGSAAHPHDSQVGSRP